jgi:hypothetical protein
MADIRRWLDQHYITERTVLAPVTLVIDRVVWDEDATEALIYFKGELRPYAIRDGDWLSLRAITGEPDCDRWPGRSVRLYPVNYPKPDLELF